MASRLDQSYCRTRPHPEPGGRVHVSLLTVNLCQSSWRRCAGTSILRSPGRRSGWRAEPGTRADPPAASGQRGERCSRPSASSAGAQQAYKHQRRYWLKSRTLGTRPECSRGKVPHPPWNCVLTKRQECYLLFTHSHFCPLTQLSQFKHFTIRAAGSGAPHSHSRSFHSSSNFIEHLTNLER